MIRPISRDTCPTATTDHMRARLPCQGVDLCVGQVSARLMSPAWRLDTGQWEVGILRSTTTMSVKARSRPSAFLIAAAPAPWVVMFETQERTVEGLTSATTVVDHLGPTYADQAEADFATLVDLTLVRSRRQLSFGAAIVIFPADGATKAPLRIDTSNAAANSSPSRLVENHACPSTSAAASGTSPASGSRLALRSTS